ncbi:hypothetical protein AGMMS50230_00570 [Spirochaetia bacterium]|nr:hypothetical protein AGMMS50230_00570 [Spirochaetia bacterium]
MKQLQRFFEGIRKPGLLFFCAFVMMTFPLTAQDGTVKGTLDWERMELDAAIRVDLQRAGIKLPAGRAQAEALLEDQYTALLRPAIMALQADSSSTVEDLVNWGEVPAETLTNSIRRVPPAMDADLSAISGNYAVNLSGLSAALTRHSRPRTIAAPLIPVPAKPYTGIIIIADEDLPVHGRSARVQTVPCLFPKVWDSEMNLIFERNMLDLDAELDTGGRRIKVRDWGMIRYINRDSITRSVPSALAADLTSRVGENPLAIMARGVFGAVPTDPVIDREDALLILSSENNRRLLREGRVAIVLDKTVLKKTFP